MSVKLLSSVVRLLVGLHVLAQQLVSCLMGMSFRISDPEDVYRNPIKELGIMERPAIKDTNGTAKQGGSGSAGGHSSRSVLSREQPIRQGTYTHVEVNALII